MTIGFQKSFGQGVGISEVSITPHASSILELRSTQRGFLTPRMTSAERDAIPTPATGLIIYNTTTDKLNIYDGSTWLVLFSGNNGVNSITGTANRISIGGTSADPIIDIDANYAGQASINTLGTITTGTWNANLIDVQYGSTGLSAITANNLLYGNGTGAISLLAPDATTGTLLMNNAAGAPSWSLLNNLPSTAGVLPIANGGTNSNTALTNNQLMISSGDVIVEAGALTNGQIIVGKDADAPQLVTLGGDATIDNTGALTISDDAVTTVKIADANVTTAKIADNNVTLAKLVDGAANQILTTDATGNPQYEDKSNFTSSSLTSANIFVGNAANVATDVALSGDATIDNTGALT
ncbi:MAG: hypothetical protein GPJ50_14025, partial [Candidatus Heimdallarchaeota archaeon]|nr:hypothetical protein [Candidatus Heimdallarchaeota archaeon]